MRPSWFGQIKPRHPGRRSKPRPTRFGWRKDNRTGLTRNIGLKPNDSCGRADAPEVWVGATFLPLCIPTAKGKEKLKTNIDLMQHNTETLLIVDDECIVRRFVGKLLQRLGYTVLQAASGTEALGVWQEHKARIQLLLTDICMPNNMNGQDLAQRLLAEKPDLPVIYTSGYGDNLEVGKLKLVEGVNFISKPYQIKQLTDLLRKHFDQESPVMVAA